MPGRAAPDPYQRRIGQRVFDARTAKDMTQQELADRIGLTRSSVANIEAGRQAFDAVQLAVIARALGVAMDELVRADDLPPEPAPPAPLHEVEVRQVFEVTCLTCGPGQPMDAAPTRARANRVRRQHIADMQERERAANAR